MNAKVRAVERIVDDGRLFAEPGDVGEVLASETYPDGTVALTVSFPGVTGCTTCFLGLDVVPLFSVVTEPVEAPAPVFQRPPARPAGRCAAIAAAAALGALMVWPSSAPLPAPSPLHAAPEAAVVVDVSRQWGERLHAGKLPEKFPETWRRVPCERTHRVVRGACFLELRQLPPCEDGYEVEGRCLVPIAATPREPTSIQR